MASSFTLVHTADLHLDLPVQGWKDAERLAERRLDYRSTFRRIIDLVQEREAAFLVIAGDFLEHGYVDRSTLDFVQAELDRIPDTRVIVAPGNHDPWRPDSCYRTIRWPESVHILSGEWEEHVFPEYDLYLYGKGFTDFVEREKSLPTLRGDGGRRLLVAHGTLLEQEAVTDYFPLLMPELAPLELDYVALGHIHQPATRRLDNERRTWIRYPGSPEALRWKETGERTVTVTTWDESGVRLEQVPVHSRRYEVEMVDVEGCETDRQVAAFIAGNIPPGQERHQCLRFILQGERPPETEFSPDRIAAELKAEGFFYVECLDRSVPGFDLERLQAGDGLVAAYIRRMEKKMETASPEERDILQAALHKGLALLMAEVESG
ncbi:MAG: DNA repair exonuclease [Firmicutes bacterium]|uniref:DNA repair exonuclease SbcCD nuclease subunit n=1 Tax=Melghirimyces thermohalophilus TaxID=1236220 RepID=A0A1G6KLG7_9BACL|nr:DNA repair exonuclease [Melghirimyces thermohalophilus]MDA8353792.1 DNA repair exonuclease [Bacillota bacterium]SDC31880.1 DNA repair exonuclease SbcCD nuclease subunit [Melghirimyces thermohalophilus]